MLQSKTITVSLMISSSKSILTDLSSKNYKNAEKKSYLVK